MALPRLQRHRNLDSGDRSTHAEAHGPCRPAERRTAAEAVRLGRMADDEGLRACDQRGGLTARLSGSLFIASLLIASLLIASRLGAGKVMCATLFGAGGGSAGRSLRTGRHSSTSSADLPSRR